MKKVHLQYVSAKALYDASDPSVDACVLVAKTCLFKLKREATAVRFGDFHGKPDLEYWIFEKNEDRSRPFRPELFEMNIEKWEEMYSDFRREITKTTEYDRKIIDRFIYTLVTSFCLAYDIWKPRSRKTPGTFFEVLIGSICRLRYPDFALSKHVAIVDDTLDANEIVEEVGHKNGSTNKALEGNSVSTDLVVQKEKSGKAAILPLKITTRERIVQPFAHQTILESAYPGKYKSFLTCISEVQRDDKTKTVKQICVPGTVALYQKHLSPLAGLYYCDVPQRYNRKDFRSVIPVKTLADVFADIDKWLDN